MRADRPSSTASLIAASTVFLAADRRVRALVSPEAARWSALCLEAPSLSGELFDRQLRQQRDRSLQGALEYPRGDLRERPLRRS